MAYGILYQSNYEDVNLNDTRIDILEKDYASSSEEVDSGADPLVISFGNEGDDRLQTIKGEEADISLISDTNFKYLRLFSSDNSKHLVVAYKGDTSAELLANRTFEGSNTGWTEDNFGWDTFSTKVNGTLGDAEMTQEVTLEDGETYVCEVYWCDAIDGERIEIEHNSTVIDGANWIGESGYYDFVWNQSGTVTADFTIRKTWTVGSTPAASNLRLTEVNLRKSGESNPSHIMFKGFVTPDLYVEPLLPPPYESSISATCGLGRLKEIPYEVENRGSDNEFYTGEETIMTVIARILNKTGVYLPIQTSVNLWNDEAGMINSSDVFNSLYVTNEAFHDYEDSLDCYTVLDRILRSFGARIYQSEGYWKIERIMYKLNESRKYHVYDQFGNHMQFVSSGVNDIVEITTLSATDHVTYINNTQELELEPALKEVKMTENYQYKESIFHGIFRQEYWTGGDPTYWWIINESSSNVVNEEDYMKLVGSGFDLQYNEPTIPGWSSYMVRSRMYDFNGTVIPGIVSSNHVYSLDVKFSYKVYTSDMKELHVKARMCFYNVDEDRVYHYNKDTETWYTKSDSEYSHVFWCEGVGTITANGGVYECSTGDRFVLQSYSLTGGSSGDGWVGMRREHGYNEPETSGTLTKVSGTGPSTISYYRWENSYGGDEYFVLANTHDFNQSNAGDEVNVSATVTVDFDTSSGYLYFEFMKLEADFNDETNVADYWMVRNLKVSVSDKTASFMENDTYTHTIDEDNINVDEYEVFYGDMEGNTYWSEYSIPMFYNGYLGFYEVGSPNDSLKSTDARWSFWGNDANTLDIIRNILCNDWTAMYSTPNFMVTSDVSGGLNFHNILTDDYVYGKTFLFNGGELSDKNQTIRGEWIELKQGGDYNDDYNDDYSNQEL